MTKEERLEAYENLAEFLDDICLRDACEFEGINKKYLAKVEKIIEQSTELREEIDETLDNLRDWDANR